MHFGTLRKEKKKAPSAPAMYEILTCDVYASQKAIINLSDINDLPEPPIKSTHKVCVCVCVCVVERERGVACECHEMAGVGNTGSATSFGCRGKVMVADYLAAFCLLSLSLSPLPPLARAQSVCIRC